MRNSSNKSRSDSYLQQPAICRSANREQVRLGFSLIELLVVLAMLFVVLTLIGTSFYFLMRSEKQVTNSLLTERTIMKLANQFRDDLHQATAAELSDHAVGSSNELTLQGVNENRVRYQTSKEGLVRLQIEAATVVGREDYRLPDCQVSFETPNASVPNLFTLVIERPGATVTRMTLPAIPLRKLKIQAMLPNQISADAVQVEKITSGEPAENAEANKDTSQ